MYLNQHDLSTYPLRRSRWEGCDPEPIVYSQKFPSNVGSLYDPLFGPCEYPKPFPDYIDLFAPKGSPLQNTSVRYYPPEKRPMSYDSPHVGHTHHHNPPVVEEEVKKEPEVKNEPKPTKSPNPIKKPEPLDRNKVDSEDLQPNTDTKTNQTVSIPIKPKPDETSSIPTKPKPEKTATNTVSIPLKPTTVNAVPVDICLKKDNNRSKPKSKLSLNPTPSATSYPNCRYIQVFIIYLP